MGARPRARAKAPSPKAPLRLSRVVSRLTRKAAAAVRTEGNNGFAGEIVQFKKGVQNHRHIPPPVGIAEKNDIVAGNIDGSGNSRAGICVLFFLGQINQSSVIGGIGNLRNDAEYVAAGHFLNQHGHILSVAENFSVDDDGTVFLFPGHIVGIVRFRHGKVDDKGFCFIGVCSVGQGRTQQGSKHTER